MKRLINIFVFFLLVNLPMLQAQEMSLFTKTYLKNCDENEWVNVEIKGDQNEIIAYIKKNHGFFKRIFNGSIQARLKSRTIKKLQTLPFIQSIDFRIDKGQPLNDSSLVNNGIISIHQGQPPLLDAYSGEGIVMGFIDSGISFEHGDFKDSLGNSRVIAIWDQTQAFDSIRTPSEYGYGQVWTNQDIDNGICTHVEQGSHGSSVTGLGAGNGLASGVHKGIGYKAAIISVSSDYGAANWTQTVADGVDFIFHVADSLGKPCVINASVGTYSGSHDAQDDPAKFIDSLVTAKTGRFMACAAGNSGGLNYHLGYDVTTDTSFTWFTYNASSALGTGAVMFEVWTDTADFNQVNYAVGIDRIGAVSQHLDQTNFISPYQNLGTTINDTLREAGQVLGVVEMQLEQLGGRYRLQVLLNEPDSNHLNFSFMTTGSGKFDLWSASWMGTSDVISTGLPTAVQFPDIVNYQLPDHEQTIVSSFSCAPNVVTVANHNNSLQYVNFNNAVQDLSSVSDIPFDIAPNSSQGPTRDQRQKPDLAATGSVTMSAAKPSDLVWFQSNQPFKLASGGMHVRNGGTSMAAPVIAGIAALYLEKCPNADAIEIRNAIINTAYADGFTGTTPNFVWGYGKTNGSQVLNQSNYTVTINRVDDWLIAPSGINYQWFLDGDLLSGQDSLALEMTTPGNYHLMMSDSSGCLGVSDTLYHSLTNIEELVNRDFKIYPNPAQNEFFISNYSEFFLNIQVTDVNGKVLFENRVQNNSNLRILSSWGKGIYFVQLFNEGKFHTRKLVIQ